MRSGETDQPWAFPKRGTSWDKYKNSLWAEKIKAIEAFQETLGKFGKEYLLISDVPDFIGFWRTSEGIVTYKRFGHDHPCYRMWDPDSRIMYSEKFIATLNFLMTQPTVEGP